MDVHTKKQRSYNMSKIKAKHTKPELVIAKLLTDLRIPFISHLNNIPGRPDFYIPHLNLIIEIYGCFWHKHENCRFFKIPKSNVVFWEKKLHENQTRDKLVKRSRSKLGFKAHIIWECQLKDGSFFTTFLNFLCKPS